MTKHGWHEQREKAGSTSAAFCKLVSKVVLLSFWGMGCILFKLEKNGPCARNDYRGEDIWQNKRQNEEVRNSLGYAVTYTEIT